MPRPTSFYYSFLVLPAEQRRAIEAVWDFCRAVDDTVDESPPEHVVPAGRAGIAFWRREIAVCYDTAQPQTACGRRLKPFIDRYGLPRQAFEDVIDGVAMDLDVRRYRTFDDLLEYCRRVASAVGMVCIRIFGCTNPRSEEYAFNLGVALQLTNILRDVRSDFGQGRVYLPLDDLATHGCTEEDLSRPKASDAVRDVIAFECTRARAYYERAIEARNTEDRPRLVAAEIMRAVYFETLRKIERADFDVLAAPVKVPRPRQALIAVRQWMWPA
jgi:phytoene synthase